MSNVDNPAVITLNEKNTVEILSKYVEVAQQKGAYFLQEAEVLKRACDVLFHNIVDKEVNTNTAKQLLIQGVVKGQQHGAYTLNDASLLHKAITFVSSSLQQASQPQASQPQASQPQASQPQASQPQASQPQEDDLSDLAEPIPLKPKEV
jgi:predicted Zn-dependent protease